MNININDFRVPPKTGVKLDECPTRVEPLYQSKREYKKLLRAQIARLTEHQQLHCADDRANRKQGYLMGIFTRLYAERESVFVQGNGQFDLQVITESRRQKYLEALCGGYSIKGSKQEVIAKLHYENGNASDKYAIRIVVNGGTVGYLLPDKAHLYRRKIEKAGQDGIIVSCKARIVGGKKVWLFKKTKFHVWIDLPIEKL